ncbi:hypothetical protein CI109_105539 [Kwoniella shandongensis]|uniref:Uncharacterized protein n=1 Tax=Kwoniella shandongensis TaxID=1734106 RepID=A0AAJ8LKK4_9TREE
MTTPSSRYQLSCELVPPHSDDVKAVLAINDDLLASASRDSSVAIWKRTEHNQFNLAGLLNGHHAYVNSLAHIPANSDEEGRSILLDELTADLLASGGNSSLILLHSLSALDSESRACLIGHTLNVCALNYSQTRRKLISGSWDQTARVWSRESGEWNCDLILEGHDQAVWGVAIVEEGPKEGHYLTADRLINLWNTNGELLLRIKGSPEPMKADHSGSFEYGTYPGAYCTRFAVIPITHITLRWGQMGACCHVERITLSGSGKIKANTL